MVGIFVGGRGSRMGGKKKGLLPTIEPGAPTILERLQRTIQIALGRVRVVLVGNSEGYSTFELPTLSDVPAEVGPIGGLHAALLHAAEQKASHLIALACDLPYLEPEVLIALEAHSHDAMAVAPLVGAGIFEPLIARFTVDQALHATEAALSMGRHSLQFVLGTLHCEALALSDTGRKSLRDWDRPEDMEA